MDKVSGYAGGEPHEFLSYKSEHLLPDVQAAANMYMAQASTYMEALCKFFGIDEYACVYADGIDVQELDGEEILREAIEETKGICTRLSCE